MKRSEAIRLRKLMEKAAELGLGDAEALEGAVLFPKWDGAGQYAAGQRVRYNGILYHCLQEHQAQPGWDPVSAPSLWARVLIKDPNTVPDWVQPDSTNAYTQGDKVRHLGRLWVSVVPGNIWAPGVYGWEEQR